MKKQLGKNYDPSVIDERIYKNWMDKKYFHAEADKSKKPYTIVIPPPNITGHLHMGHALDNTMQDILIRWRRMQGYNALWLPGTDHASISTEVKIVAEMAKEGITKSDIGREGFLKRAYAWKEQYGSTIIKQLQKLGSSCDWDRERFTMDEGLSKAVNEVFIRLYNKNYIYRGEKIVNWCPTCQTTISDAEVNHLDRQDCFWHVKYKISGLDEYLQIATTRPETILGDTAVAVNPKDDRYKKYVGKTCILPIVNKEIPIVADDYVDIEFGTGVVKITPAHDPNDFEVGERHNLPRINIMNDDGTLNENAGEEYKGLDRYDARKKIVSKLEEMGALVKVEEISHAVGAHERCDTTVEPLIKLQWFVKMEEMAKPALDAYKNKELNFIPDRFGKVYSHWLENIKDWCISRQLWWGHRIPAYYCDECGHIDVSATAPDACSKCQSKNLTQDEDTLDTWFSSALWPFSTLGWPEKTEDLDYFYPTSVLVTGYDIIFFWVVRMVFSGIEQTGRLPFKDVLIHGLIRDAKGRKMSKSLGNGIDPLEIIEKYGADALRLTLVTGNAPGNDLRFNTDRVEASRNFSNKIWNATKFLLMNIDDGNDTDEVEPTIADKWILSRLSRAVKEATDNLENYELGIAAQKIQDFIWDEYCDWYIEMVKPRLYNKEDKTRPTAINTLKTVLICCLKLLHPFMPFITEEIFTSIQTDEETIMLSKWPKATDGYPEEEKEVELIKTAVRSIRNVRSEMNVAPSKRVTVYIVSENDAVRQTFENSKVFFQTLSFAIDVIVMDTEDDTTKDCVSAVIPGGTVYLPLTELIDVSKELERLSRERDRLSGEVKRAHGKLNNEGFLNKAPDALINEEKAKHEKYLEMLSQIEKQISALKG